MPMPISANGNLMPAEPAMSASAMTDTKLKGTNHSARPRKQAANNPTETIARIWSMPLSSTGGTHRENYFNVCRHNYPHRHINAAELRTGRRNQNQSFARRCHLGLQLR